MLKRLTTAPVVCTQKRSSDGSISNLMGDGSFKEGSTISLHSAILMSLRLNAKSFYLSPGGCLA